ncbi:Rep [uncultured virus]|uniref:Rep n=1 Tax=uncultured virus TaxID=340016 RepID=A0A2K9LSA8_9VIRU|nr:Rep [uncultured virus]
MQTSHWCFTSFKDNLDIRQDPRIKYYVYQRELSPTTEREHWQGYIEFTRSVKLGGVKIVLNDRAAHLEVRSGPREAARAYCMKEDSRLPGSLPIEYGKWDEHAGAGQRTDLIEARQLIGQKRKLQDCYDDPLLDPITTKYPKWVERVHANNDDGHEVNIDLKDWQREVYHLLSQAPEHRRIIWIYSDESGTGKTTFMDFVSTKRDVLPASGKLADILYAYDKNEIIWFDMARTESGDIYTILENLSNIGYKLSTKYLSVKKFVKAHIVVTSNYVPDIQRLPKRFVCFEASL